jgi:hypothetical protein
MIEAEAAGTAPAAATAAAELTAKADSALHAPAARDTAGPADRENPRGAADASWAAAHDSFSTSNSPGPSHRSDPGGRAIDAVEASVAEAVDAADAVLPQTAPATGRAEAEMPGGADEVLSLISSAQSPSSAPPAESRHDADAPGIISPQTEANAAALEMRPGTAADAADHDAADMVAGIGHGRRELRAAAGLMQLLKQLARAGAGNAASDKERRTPGEAQVGLRSPR